MPTIDQIYRDNLRLLIKEAGSQEAFSSTIKRSPGQISQWVNASKDSKTGKPRTLSRQMAREIERLCGKSEGWMDQVHERTESPGARETEEAEKAPPTGRRKGDFVKAITPKEQALLDELLEYFRDLLPSDRAAKLEELRALAKVRAAERKELLEEAGMGRIMEKAANATRRQAATATSTPRTRPPVIDPNAPELPHIPPPDETE